MMLMPPSSALSGALSAGAATGMPAITTENGSCVSQKDTTFTKIFVGGLPYHTTDKSLREHFEIYGDIEEAVVITDRQTGKSRGYGFVTMADRAAAERAYKEPNPIIDGRKANVNLAYLGAKPRGNLQPGAFPIPGIRYPTLLPSQYSLPPGYVYQSPYLPTPGLVPLSHTPLSPTASQFYDYQAAFAGSYPLDPYTTSAASVAAAGFVPGYTYPAALAGSALTAAGAPITVSPYGAAAQPQLQEARMQ